VAGKMKKFEGATAMQVWRTFPIVCLAMAASTGIGHAQDVTIKVGMVKSITSVVALLAIDKGYFKEFGIKV
jgi:ABC-type nitrate/sulfonate/bicarbonate transport system substrate-binding protein